MPEGIDTAIQSEAETTIDNAEDGQEGVSSEDSFSSLEDDHPSAQIFQVTGAAAGFGTGKEYYIAKKMNNAGLLSSESYLKSLEAEYDRAEEAAEVFDKPWRDFVRNFAKEKGWKGRLGSRNPVFGGSRGYYGDHAAILSAEEVKLFEESGFTPLENPNIIQRHRMPEALRWINRFVGKEEGKGRTSRDALRNMMTFRSPEAKKILAEMVKEGEAFREGLRRLNPDGYVTLFRGEPFSEPRKSQPLQSYSMDPTWTEDFARGMTDKVGPPRVGCITVERVPIDRVVVGINSEEHELIVMDPSLSHLLESPNSQKVQAEAA